MVKVNEVSVRRGMVSAQVEPYEVIAADGMKVRVDAFVMPIEGSVVDISVWGREIKANGRPSRYVNPEGVEIPQDVVNDLFAALA